MTLKFFSNQKSFLRLYSSMFSLSNEFHSTQKASFTPKFLLKDTDLKLFLPCEVSIASLPKSISSFSHSLTWRFTLQNNNQCHSEIIYIYFLFLSIFWISFTFTSFTFVLTLQFTILSHHPSSNLGLLFLYLLT